jgi:hypothetical protein
VAHPVKVMGNRLQCLEGPLAEPVNGAAVDEGREHAQPLPESISDWTHREHEVQLAANAAHKVCIHGHLGDRPLGVHQRPHCSGNLLRVVHFHQVRHLTSVEDVVNVLEHALPHDLRVCEEEHDILALDASHLQHTTQVVAPLVLTILLADLDLVTLELLHVHGKARKGLAARAADAKEEGVPAGSADNAADAGDVLDGVLEHDELHRRCGDGVAVFEVLLNNALQVCHVGDAAVHLDLCICSAVGVLSNRASKG